MIKTYPTSAIAATKRLILESIYSSEIEKEGERAGHTFHYALPVLP